MKKMLVAESLKDLLFSSVQFLGRSDIMLLAARSADELLRMHFELHAHLIATKLFFPGMGCETLVHVIRRSEALRNVSILVLHDDRPGYRERSAQCGANAVLALPADPGVLGATLQKLLDIPPRRAYRVVMNMAVDGSRGDRTFLCTTENLSSSGMLIRTTEALSAGDRIGCSFYLPDGTRVGADGEVVRLARTDKPGAQNQYGIHFVKIAPEAEAAIAAFVSRELGITPPQDREQALVA